MRAPIWRSMRARSWTWGSDAALWITVAPGVRAAAMRAFSVAITDGSSMKKSHALRPFGALRRYPKARSWLTCVPSARKASRCGSRRRRPITSPPGVGISARPKRASSGPATRKLARIRSAICRSTASGSIVWALSETTLSSRQAISVPSPFRRPSIASTSRMRGTLRTITSSSVRRQAARAGRAAFLLPAGAMLPGSGGPPSITNFSMRAAILSGADDGAGRGAKGISVRGFSTHRGATLPAWPDPRRGRVGFGRYGGNPRRGLAALLRVDAVGVAPQARARRRGRDGRLRARVRRGRGALGGHRDPARPRLREVPGPRDRAPTVRLGGAALAWVSGRDDRRDRGPRGVPGRVARDLAREDPVRGRRAVGLHRRVRVGPADGHPRHDAEVREEEAEDAGVRGGREPRRGAAGRGGARGGLR